MFDPQERQQQDEREHVKARAEAELSVDHVLDLDPGEEDAAQVKGATGCCATVNCNQ